MLQRAASKRSIRAIRSSARRCRPSRDRHRAVASAACTRRTRSPTPPPPPDTSLVRSDARASVLRSARRHSGLVTLRGVTFGAEAEGWGLSSDYRLRTWTITMPADLKYPSASRWKTHGDHERDPARRAPPDRPRVGRDHRVPDRRLRRAPASGRKASMRALRGRASSSACRSRRRNTRVGCAIANTVDDWLTLPKR